MNGVTIKLWKYWVIMKIKKMKPTLENYSTSYFYISYPFISTLLSVQHPVCTRMSNFAISEHPKHEHH